METSRFFVANLPSNTKEKDLRNIFQDYGEIKSVELKTKDNLVDPTDVKVIAFVTLYLGAEDAQYSLNDLNWCKINGQQIKVSLAKESFLERLKREREEAQSGADGQQAVQQTEEEQSELLKAPKLNKRKTFDIDVDLGDDDVAIELMITKKRAANSMFNGKIVIQSQDVEPIHIIETKQNKKKQKVQLDEKATSADQKRKESLNKKKNQYQQNKTAIQQALQGLDASKVASKKIKFSDNESDIEEPKDKPAKKSKTNIFGSDDDDGDEEDIQFKTMPSGKKGERLVEMQAKQSMDPRFRIDAKFVDGEEAENEEHYQEEETQEGEVDERQWQMNILEQVVGTKLDNQKVGDKTHKNKKMLHYDPSKDEHQKYERTKDDIEKSKKSKQKNKTTIEAEQETTKNGPEVSKEVFYVVTDTLQQSLRTRGEGFSLLNMFGKSEHVEERDEQLKQLGKEKILVNNNKLEKVFTANPFTYDSSSESETEDHAEQENSVKKSNANMVKPTKTKNKLKIATESFFIPKNDKRLKEGAKFFIYHKDTAETTEDYEEVRNRLKMLIKNKISKSKKNLANAGYKGKRRKA